LFDSLLGPVEVATMKAVMQVLGLSLDY
jgi:hypothetical protein